MNTKNAIDTERTQLSADLAGEDDLGAVVRGHIRIENLLVRYIEATLPGHKHLKGLRLGYYGNTALALSLGLREDLKEPLRVLGKIRNGFAHDSNANLSEDSAIQFLSSFSEEDRGVLERSILKISDPDRISRFTHKDRFRLAVSTLWAACRVEVKVAEELKAEDASE